MRTLEHVRSECHRSMQSDSGGVTVVAWPTCEVVMLLHYHRWTSAVGGTLPVHRFFDSVIFSNINNQTSTIGNSRNIIATTVDSRKFLK